MRAYPSGPEIVALVALHGSCPAVDRALDWPNGTLSQWLRRPSRAALRATCAAYARAPSEMRDHAHSYPPDDELVRLMAEAGNFNALARAVGVRRESLRDYLSRRPALRAWLERARPPKPTVVERQERKRERGREYMRQRRLEDPNTVRVRRRLSMAGTKPLGDRPPVDPDMHAYAGVLRRDPCAYCGAPCEHIDHIDPVKHGGGLGWENLTASCGTCNRRKQARSLLVFMLEGGDAR